MTCSHCANKILARGLCSKHYRAWALYGDAAHYKPRGERLRKHEAWLEKALLYESDACLLWPFAMRGGRRPQDAYPALGGQGYAHVWVCEQAHGTRPTEHHETEHLCGVHRCVNKRHVQWALHKDNCARRTQHGTQTIGEQHGMVKLTEREVVAIIRAPRDRGTGVRLAVKYGVSPSTICHIRHGKSWAHL